MAIFLLAPSTGKDAIKAAMQGLKSTNTIDYIDLPSGASFVRFSGTAEELSGLVGITDGRYGTGVVAAVSSYYGREATNVWEWVSTRWES